MWRIIRVYLAFTGIAAHVLAGVLLIVIAQMGPAAAYKKFDEIARKVYVAGKSISAEIPASLGLGGSDLYLEPSYDAFEASLVPTLPVAGVGYGRVLRVGPGAEFRVPSEAAKAAKNGDVIEIESGTYAADSTVWRASDLLIRGVGGAPRLDANGHRLVQDKAIWIIQGHNVQIDNIEFTGASSRDRNGAGIRAEGNRLHISRCFFHDNESGILAGRINDARILVEHSEFARNGGAAGQAHQIYVGRIEKLEVRFSYFHDTRVGSAIKSRAKNSFITYNRITDGRDGNVNYSIDLSSGGRAIVIGNVIQQNQKTGNYTLVSYAPEGQNWDAAGTLIAHNTIVNDRNGGRFIKNHDDVPINVYNNVFVGSGKVIEGKGLMFGNVWMGEDAVASDDPAGLGCEAGSRANRTVAEVQIQDRERYDYRLRSGSAAIDAGVKLPSNRELPYARIDFEYRHPMSIRARENRGGAPDAGAFEYDATIGAKFGNH